MAIIHQRITIVRLQKPVKRNLNEELQWFGGSLGLFNLRDKDQSCFRIFIELLKSTRKGIGLSSDELASRLNLSRGTIMHHINKLVEAGIVISYKGKYLLRVGNLEAVIEEIRKDLERACDDLTSIAREIDQGLGL